MRIDFYEVKLFVDEKELFKSIYRGEEPTGSLATNLFADDQKDYGLPHE